MPLPSGSPSRLCTLQSPAGSQRQQGDVASLRLGWGQASSPVLPRRTGGGGSPPLPPPSAFSPHFLPLALHHGESRAARLGALIRPRVGGLGKTGWF